MLFFQKKILFQEVAEVVRNSKELMAVGTKKAATRQLNRLISNFGTIPVAELKEEDWTSYLLREKLKRARDFFDDRKYMNQCILYSIRNGFRKTPLKLVLPHGPSNGGREISLPELKRLEANANPGLRFQIRIAWKMGLRLREMLKLEWATHVDIENALITLRPCDTKTQRGRQVPIPSDLLAEFSAWRTLGSSRFVFPGESPDKPRHANNTAWELCKRKSQVKARWHDLRHTCASLLLRRAIPIHIAKRYLGMSDGVLTRIYAHVTVDDLRKAAEVMRTSE